MTTDGSYLYEQTVEDNAPYRLDPNDPEAEPVDWFMARDGSRYMVTVNEDEILVELPDAAVPLTRSLRTRYSEVSVIDPLSPATNRLSTRETAAQKAG